MPDSHLKKIESHDLICMNCADESFGLRIFMAYASNNPLNMFNKIYSDQALFWVQKDLAKVVLLAAHRLKNNHDYHMVLYDSLRTSDAQTKMSDSKIVRDNPHWLEGPDMLLAPPGAGAHPRAMAIDIGLETASGDTVDMGTVFDYFAEKPDADHNPAHRFYTYLSEEHAKNRHILDSAMKQAAHDLSISLVLYHAEWWDFRLPDHFYDQYTPLSESDLDSHMRLIDPQPVADIAKEQEKIDSLIQAIQAFL